MLFGLPHLIGKFQLGAHYTPFSLGASASALITDETASYAVAPRKLLRTGTAPGELRVHELREHNIGYPVVPPVVISGAALVFGSLERAWIALDFLLPAGTWLLAWWLAGRFTTAMVLRSSVAWLFVLLPFGPRNTLLIGEHALRQPLELTRLPQPSLSFPIMLGALALAAHAAERRKTAVAVAAGMLGGVLFYTYYFYWVITFGALLLAAAVMLLQRGGDQARHPGIAFVTGVIMGLPFFINFLGGLDAGTQALMERVGAFSRTPQLLHFVLMAVMLMALATYAVRMRTVGNSYLTAVASAATAAAIGLNLHVLTGYNAQHGHFMNRGLQPMLFLTVLLPLLPFIEKRLLARRALSSAAVLVIALAVFRQAAVGINTAAEHDTRTPRMRAALWIRSNLDADAVVGSLDPSMMSLVPAIAGNWAFVPFGEGTAATNDEIVLRFLTLAKIQQVSADSLVRLARKGGNAHHRLPYVLTLRQDAAWLESQIRARYHDIDVQQVLSTRRLDYIVSHEDFSVQKYSPAIQSPPTSSSADM